MPVSLPSVTLSIIPATQLSGVTAQKVLIVGQISASGAAASAGTLHQNVQADGSEKTKFGIRSHLAHMIQAFKADNKVTQLDVFTVADPTTAAAQATATITCTDVVGDATEAGTISIQVGNVVKDVSVAVGDGGEDLADAIVTAFTDTDYAFGTPVKSGTGPWIVTFTIDSNGAVGNDLPIIVGDLISGTDVVVTTGFDDGAGIVVYSGLAAAIQNIRYQTIVWPSAYTVADITTIVDDRFNETNEVMDGIAVQTVCDTLTTLKSAALAENSQNLVMIAQNPVTVTGGAVYPSTNASPDYLSVQVAAIRSLRLTEDALLTDYLTTTARQDQYGGIGLASLPYFNTALPNLPVADPTEDYSLLEYAELASNGLAAAGPNRAYSGSVFGEFVTTYINDTAGNPDSSYKYLNTVDTVSVIREFFFENLKSRYAQTRLTTGDLIQGKAMANEPSIRAFCHRLYDELADEGLVQKGTAAKQDYNANLSITVDIANGKVTIDQAPLLVTQLRVIIGTVQVNFGG